MSELQSIVDSVPAPIAEKVRRLESALLEMPQEECPTKHYLAPGVYAREMLMRAGTTVTGATHKRTHIAVIVGDVSLYEGGEVKRLTGHNTVITPAGTKRAIYAHADTYMTGFFVTDKTDIQEIERELVEEADMLQSNRMQVSEVISCS